MGTTMLQATDLEVRAGARLLLEPTTFRVNPGDKIGLVGRNGAGKTTMMRILAGEGIPAAGQVTRRGEIGYLPQDPRETDVAMLARDRILSARGLDTILVRLRNYEKQMAATSGDEQQQAMASYARAEAELMAAGGYGAEAEAARLAEYNSAAARAIRLRTERDARLAVTDKYLLSDYPISAEDLATVKAYRQALRDLPAQEGAPFDGGGHETPWPELPSVG